MEIVFSDKSGPRLYNEDPRPVDNNWESQLRIGSRE
jgi:hypothetical protein